MMTFTKRFGPDQPPPGSVLLARAVERRRFLRRSATTVFYGAVATTTGAISLGTFLATPSIAQTPQGGCCPRGCGPSPCCGTDCCTKQCCSGRFCNTTKDGSCNGFDATWPSMNPRGCWSGTVGGGGNYLCCDCRIDNTNGCKNSVNRCICVG